MSKKIHMKEMIKITSLERGTLNDWTNRGLLKAKSNGLQGKKRTWDEDEAYVAINLKRLNEMGFYLIKAEPIAREPELIKSARQGNRLAIKFLTGGKGTVYVQ